MRKNLLRTSDRVLPVERQSLFFLFSGSLRLSSLPFSPVLRFPLGSLPVPERPRSFVRTPRLCRKDRKCEFCRPGNGPLFSADHPILLYTGARPHITAPASIGLKLAQWMTAPKKLTTGRSTTSDKECGDSYRDEKETGTAGRIRRPAMP